MKKDIDSSSLAEVVDRILEKGIIIHGYVRVPLLGIELLSVDFRVVIVGIQGWLFYSAAVGLDEQLYDDF